METCLTVPFFCKRLPQPIHQVRKFNYTSQYLVTALLTPGINYCTRILGNKLEKNTSGR